MNISWRWATVIRRKAPRCVARVSAWRVERGARRRSVSALSVTGHNVAQPPKTLGWCSTKRLSSPDARMVLDQAAQLRVRRLKTAGSQKSGRPKSVDSHTLQQTRQSPKKLPKFPNTKHWNSAPCRGPTMTSTCTRNTCIHNNQVPA